MLCDVASSFTTSNFWLARTASTCGWYMHPFCSTTTGWLGASNVRSPSPSDTNTITFCNSPFASAITSCAIRGEGCCLAHTGSAAMLIALAAGTLPSNRTLPRTDAPVVVGGGPPALTACGAEMHITKVRTRVRTKIETNFFEIMTSPQFKNSRTRVFISLRHPERSRSSGGGRDLTGIVARSEANRQSTAPDLLSPARAACRSASQKVVVPPPIAGRERSPIPFVRPAPDLWMQRPSCLGGEPAHVKPVAERPVGRQWRVRALLLPRGPAVVRQQCRSPQADRNRQCVR